MATTAKQRWYRFSLKTLLVVMTLLAVGLGFYVNSYRQRRAAVAAIEDLGGVMGVQYMGPEWLRSRVQDEKYFWDPAGVHFNGSDHQLTDAELKRVMPYLKTFERLQDLSLPSPKITNAAIPMLLPLANKLVNLDLSQSQITVDALVHLKRFRNLAMLVITHTPLSTADIDEFKKALPNCTIVQ
jgi:hypothetical protein